jgi:glycerol-1-phosphate dehydrogenase [NAD(P)+]
MFQIDTPHYVGTEAVEHLIAFCAENGLTRFFLIADDNTFAALGQRVEQALARAGIDVKPIVLHDAHVVADERTIVRALIQAGSGDDRHFLACGSGTLTDITRFVSHRTRTRFISLPTAPSVDGFLSVGAPLVIDNLKQTIPAHGPMAIFADLRTLCEAPAEMIAAGYGDLIGKLTSLADWQLGHLLWDERYDDELAAWAFDAMTDAVAHTADIARTDEDGIRLLFESLLMTGQLMVTFGNSNPASGSEHHLSHFWEMKLLLGHRTPALHGAKVGVGTIWAARRYEILKALDRAAMIDRLEAADLPDREVEIAAIRAVYGPAAEQAIAQQRPFLDMTEAGYAALRQRIADHWDEVRALADRVPPSEQFRVWLEQVGGPTDIKQLGLTAEEEQQALDHAHFFRNRFTANKLFHVLEMRLDA